MKEFKVKMLEDINYDSCGRFHVDGIYMCVGTVGDKLLLVDKDGYFAEVYARKCLMIKD